MALPKIRTIFSRKLCTGRLGVHQRAVLDAEFTLLRHKQVKRGLRLKCSSQDQAGYGGIACTSVTSKLASHCSHLTAQPCHYVTAIFKAVSTVGKLCVWRLNDSKAEMANRKNQYQQDVLYLITYIETKKPPSNSQQKIPSSVSGNCKPGTGFKHRTICSNQVLVLSVTAQY